MNIDAYRNLRLLTEISSEQPINQRSLAKKHGLALGLTNLLLRRLIQKGYVKIVNVKRNRIRYLLTPQGIAEKARLTYEYLECSLSFYRQIRAALARALSVLGHSNAKDVVLYGKGELAEIAFLTLQQNGLNVVGVLDEQVQEDAVFMSRPIRHPDDLSSFSFDLVVVASLKDRRTIVQELRRRGVPEGKIIAIPDDGGPEFHDQAEGPGSDGRAVTLSPAHPAGLAWQR